MLLRGLLGTRSPLTRLCFGMASKKKDLYGTSVDI